MTSFLQLPGILPELIKENRSRATGAGLDPYAYERVTAGLISLHDWPDAFRGAGRGHIAAAEHSEALGHRVSAGESYQVAARWFHYAVLLPHPDRATAALAAAEADDAMRRALARGGPRGAPGGGARPIAGGGGPPGRPGRPPGGGGVAPTGRPGPDR
ncbi:hypothetical protein ACWGCW_10395, partial [Streptomyces sp. NPDC054933]